MMKPARVVPGVGHVEPESAVDFLHLSEPWYIYVSSDAGEPAQRPRCRTSCSRSSGTVIEPMPGPAQYVEEYATRALDLDNLAAERMKLLSAEEYEKLMRPAFRDVARCSGRYLGQSLRQVCFCAGFGRCLGHRDQGIGGHD